MASSHKAPSTTDKPKSRAPFSWTQPCCSECWVGLKLKTGRPTDDHGTPFFCCYCRQGLDGDMRYLIRVNPGAVPYPTLRKE
jgi:hypothetical protein